MTYYEILGVGDKATAEEIKRAYRKLASQHHPDKGGDKNKFQEIEQAYRILSDNGQRQQYDMQRNGMGGPGGMQFRWHSSDMNHPDLSEIFRNFGFGADPFAQHRQQQRRNKDLRIEIPVALASTLEDQTKTVSIQTTNGERETVEVKIPRGINNGTQIKYPGLGDTLFNTLPRGDLYVVIHVANAENFHANNLDLYTQISVNCFLAVTGGTTSFTGLDGKTFELAIPAGAQPGTKFRINKQGLYQLNSDIRGDLYVELGVSIPRNLTEEQLKIVQSLTTN